jgi:Ca2+/Na+ antiporter
MIVNEPLVFIMKHFWILLVCFFIFLFFNFSVVVSFLSAIMLDLFTIWICFSFYLLKMQEVYHHLEKTIPPGNNVYRKNGMYFSFSENKFIQTNEINFHRVIELTNEEWKHTFLANLIM